MKHEIEQGRTASPIFKGNLESPRSVSTNHANGQVTPLFDPRKKSPRVMISNVDDPINIYKLKRFLQKSIKNDNKRMWKKYKGSHSTDRMKSPPPLSKTGLMVAPPAPSGPKKFPIKTGLDRIKSPRPIPDKLKSVTPRISSARSNKSSFEREQFRVFAKNIYIT